MSEKNFTIQQAVNLFIENVELARSKNTAETYRFALLSFVATLADRKLDVENMPVADLTEDAVGWFAAALKTMAPASERLYLQAVAGFYDFLAAERMASPNLPRLKL